MRIPKRPGGKSAPAEPERAGGRAWARLRQLALARGLDVGPTPSAPKTRVPGSTTALAPKPKKAPSVPKTKARRNT